MFFNFLKMNFDFLFEEFFDIFYKYVVEILDLAFIIKLKVKYQIIFVEMLNTIKNDFIKFIRIMSNENAFLRFFEKNFLKKESKSK